MAKKEAKIYCVYCGTENKKEDLKCSKCKKDLNPKNHLFKDFLYEHIRDDLKDKVTDSIFSYLKNFIISHLYGVAMSVAVIFTAVTIITGGLSPKYKVVSGLEEVKDANRKSNEVTLRVYTYDDFCVEDFDKELIDIPFAFGVTISGLKRVMQEITIKKGTSIEDYCKDGHDDELICVEDISEFNNDIEKAGNAYRKKVLDYAAWYRETNAEDDGEYYDWNIEVMDYEDAIFSLELKSYDKKQRETKNKSLYVAEVGCEYEG